MTEHQICPRDGCQVNVTGSCLEGFDPPRTCPYLSATSSDRNSANPSESSAFVDLPSGEALTEQQAAEVTREAVTRVVIVAGPSGSGKTTILTSLFESFLEAPFGNFLFAGSRTLIGFERRCHDARTASGREEAHTGHTQADVVDFLHLKLLPAPGSVLGIQNLLLSDISGERFKRLRDSADAVKAMPMLKRADHFCLIVDCEKIVSPILRHAAYSDARMLLRSIVEADALSSSCKVDVVFAKWDLVISHPEQDRVKAFIAEIRSALEALLRDVFAAKVFEIAARPTTPRVPFAFGLPTLLRYWLEEPSVGSRGVMYTPRHSKGSRESTRFSESVFRGQLEGSYDVRWV